MPFPLHLGQQLSDTVEEPAVKVLQLVPDLRFSARGYEFRKQHVAVLFGIQTTELRQEQARQRGRRVVPGQGAFDLLGKQAKLPLQMALENCEKQILLARKMPIHGAFSHAGVGGRFIQRCVGIPVLREHFRRRVENARARVGRMRVACRLFVPEPASHRFLASEMPPNRRPMHARRLRHFGERDLVERFLLAEPFRGLKHFFPNRQWPDSFPERILVIAQLHTDQYVFIISGKRKDCQVRRPFHDRSTVMLHRELIEALEFISLLPGGIDDGPECLRIIAGNRMKQNDRPGMQLAHHLLERVLRSFAIVDVPFFIIECQLSAL